jgi:mono/diheme cytochrome c family protein
MDQSNLMTGPASTRTAATGSMLPSLAAGILAHLRPEPRLVAAADSTTPDADAKAQAAEIWNSRCTACHGEDGRGDGPGAAALKPKPINFHQRNWQKVVTDEQIAKAIVEGGSAVGLSSQMPANPDLEDEDTIVKALVAHVRAFGK